MRSTSLLRAYQDEILILVQTCPRIFFAREWAAITGKAPQTIRRFVVDEIFLQVARNVRPQKIAMYAVAPWVLQRLGLEDYASPERPPARPDAAPQGPCVEPFPKDRKGRDHAYYLANRDRILVRNREYDRRHPEQVRARCRRYRLRRKERAAAAASGQEKGARAAAQALSAEVMGA